MSRYWSDLVASGQPLTPEQRRAFEQAATLLRRHIHDSLKQARPWPDQQPFDYDRHLHQLRHDFLEGTRPGSLERDVALASYHWIQHLGQEVKRLGDTLTASNRAP